METHGVGVRQLARIAETHASSISDWCNGERSTQYESLIRISRHFGVSLEWLLSGEDDGRASQIPTSIAEMFREAGSLEGFCRFRLDLLVPATDGAPKKKDGE
jgi:transcriptional regulator with XRE-family HTH domain